MLVSPVSSKFIGLHLLKFIVSIKTKRPPNEKPESLGTWSFSPDECRDKRGKGKKRGGPHDSVVIDCD